MSEILLEKPVHEARGIKDIAGREAYRPGGMEADFQGNPLLELHEEALDFANYAEHAEARNHHGNVVHTLLTQGLYHIGIGLVFIVRALWAVREKKRPNAQLGKFPVAG